MLLKILWTYFGLIGTEKDVNEEKNGTYLADQGPLTTFERMIVPFY